MTKPLPNRPPSSYKKALPRARCKQCDACLRPDCGKCSECVRKRKFGGDGSSRQACIQRRCPNLQDNPRMVAMANANAQQSGGGASSSSITTSTSSYNGAPPRNVRSGSPHNSLCTPTAGPTTSSSVATFDINNNNNNAAPTTYTIPASAMKVLSSPSMLPSDDYDQQYSNNNYNSNNGLTFKRPASLLGDRSLKRTRTEALRDRPPAVTPQHVCGHAVPDPVVGICGNCQKEGGVDAILLCDGEGCGKEFHLQCCVPKISEVPEGEFYCFDCSTKGATEQLEDYFKDFDRRRDAISENVARALLEEDVRHEFGELAESPSIPITELDHSDPAAFLGKPIRLYCPNGNHYHSGRIVDVRVPEDDDNGSDEEKKKPKDTYCLVRFAAGKDHRKTPMIVWLRLEEHCVVVGMKLLWAQFPASTMTKKERRRSSKSGSVGSSNSKWVRGMLWLRSARELVCVIKEAHGNQVLFEKQNNKSRQQTQEWGLVEDVSKLGTDSYSVLKLEYETRETLKHHDREPKIVSALVQAELAEQRRVRKWRELPLQNPFHACALRSRDEYTLGPLEYGVPPRLQIEPSPAIPQGLDRAYILEKLSSQLGLPPSKDLASSLVCELVDP